MAVILEVAAWGGSPACSVPGMSIVAVPLYVRLVPAASASGESNSKQSCLGADRPGRGGLQHDAAPRQRYLEVKADRSSPTRTR